MLLQNLSVKQIVQCGLVFRLLAMVIVLLFSNVMSEGFISSDITNDDIRYLTGGYEYARIAESIIDRDAFNNAFCEMDNIYLTDKIEVWYWYVCIGLYLFKSEIVLKLINILFAILCIKCIYVIANKLYGRNVASLASILYAVTPYPVFFCCFLYKDQLYTLVTLCLLQIAICNGKNLKKVHLIYIVILLTISVLLRSGFAVIVAAVILLIIKREGGYKITEPKMIIPLLFGFVGIIVFFIYSMDSINHKIVAYIFNYQLSSGGMVQYFLIKSPTQLLKYPFSMLFMTLLPVNLSLSMHSWNDLVCCLNVMAFPIAFGNFLYFFMIKMKKDLFWWCAQLLYLITIVTSLEIFRHSYYLVPFTMIFFSVFFLNIKNKKFYKVSTSLPILFYYMLFIFSLF